MINYVDHLFQGSRATMFINNEQFLIHPINTPCSTSTGDHNDTDDDDDNGDDSELDTIQNQVHEFVIQAYPKNRFLPMVFRNLVKSNLIDSDLFFKQFPTIHVADFCTFINNRFCKKSKSNTQLLKLCKFIRSHHIKFPSIAIKNPLAYQALS